jgi:hypothetical protein
MNGHGQRHWRTSILLAALSLGASTGCDSGGSELYVTNEWNQEVVARVRTGAGTASKSIPAGSSGTLFNSFANTQEGWTVVVFDGSCQRLAEVPFESSGLTLHIGSAGEVTMEPDGWRAPADVPRVSLVDGRCP